MSFMSTAGPQETSMATTQPSVGSATLVTVDIVVLVIYFILVLAVGFWSMWRTKRSTVDGYFLAGKSMTWWPVSVTTQTNTGLAPLRDPKTTVTFYLCSGWGITGMLMVLLLGWLFLPIYISSGVTTMPEYLQKRFGGRRTHLSLAVLSLFIYIFTKISVDMYAGAVFIQLALRWNIYLAIVLLLVITALYTVAGGLAAVIYTDAAQTAIMLAGALTLMGFSFVEVGGWSALMEGYSQAVPSVRVPNSTCGIPREDAFHIFRDPVNSDLPWPGVLIGMSIPSMWYWCSDQVIVQRSLAAKNLTHAKGGSLLAAYLKILPFFAVMLPGMISRILYTDEVACADPDLCKQICGNSVGCSDIAYAKLVMELLPSGLRGLMMAVMIAALMSSLTSIFNSSSTIFTMDLWKSFRSEASEWELMIVGRVFVLVLVVVSVLWIPVVQASQGGQLFIYIQSISTYLQPPIAIIFLMGCFWKRTNEKGAFWGLVIGLAIGCVRMLLDFIYPTPPCYEEDTRPGVLKYVHYLYFSILLSVITLSVVVVVSLATEEPTPEQVKISRLTWFTRFDPVKPKEKLEEVSSASSVSSTSSQSRWMSVIYWLCGMERRRQGENNPVTPPAFEQNICSLEEKPTLHYVVNVNLIISLSVTAFIIGYWA
uniref:Sodium/myo-inositol cotransporter 2 n=1 Tax=Oryzias melastigma TaxID=30732 RepID=A0A3B3BYH6_ORYME